MTRTQRQLFGESAKTNEAGRRTKRDIREMSVDTVNVPDQLVAVAGKLGNRYQLEIKSDEVIPDY